MESPIRHSFNPNKHLKEEFVSNLNGSSMLEIAALSTIATVLLVLRHSIRFNGVTDPYVKETSVKKNDNSTISPKTFLAYMGIVAVDFVLIVVPIFLSTTVLADWTYECAIVLVLILLLSTAVKRLGTPGYLDGGNVNRKYLSSYRVLMMILTCSSILGVDFKIFPRRYAKTETYGTSWMDTGVGQFVLANALVSRQARNIWVVFVSNLNGSSMLEIAALSTIATVLLVLRHSIRFSGVTDPYVKETSVKKNDNSTISPKTFLAYMGIVAVDFVWIVVPIFLSTTVLADWTYECAIVLVSILLLSTAVKRLGTLGYLDGSNVDRKYLSSYRVLMMILTCSSILGVDFKIFPRRYAKTETYGTSCLNMDTGVGQFVLANALVSRQARNIWVVKWKTVLQSISPLLVLGFGRLITTSGVDYQVHVGEYGVHWNFFFTLAAVSITSSIISLPPKYCGAFGSFILIGYQICLIQGLSIYLLSNIRGTGIISQNKEGIFSIFGYWGLYLIGVQLANYLFFGDHCATTSKRNEWTRRRVWVLSILLWLITLFLDSYVERVSRRMCNMAYVTLVLAQSLQVLGMLMLSDHIPGTKFSLLEAAIDWNLLGTFLLANVLTGLVNMSVDTLFVSSITAVVILLSYACLLTFVIALLHFHGIRLKFW